MTYTINFEFVLRTLERTDIPSHIKEAIRLQAKKTHRKLISIKNIMPRSYLKEHTGGPREAYTRLSSSETSGDKYGGSSFYVSRQMYTSGGTYRKRKED